MYSETSKPPLVGRDLSAAVRGEAHIEPGQPVYFMTTDDVAQGLSQITGRRQWRNVLPPNQVEAISQPTA